MGKNLCSGCGLTFGSLGAFDTHRIGSFGEAIYAPGDTKRKNPIGHKPHTRHCMTLDEIKAAGMVQNPKGWWITGQFDALTKGRMNDAEESDEEEDTEEDTDLEEIIA